jgi:NAD(P)H dehydrogenase (quinone)
MTQVIAVTGATGALGGRVAARLAERGVGQRLVVRDPARAPDLPGAEVARASDYGDRDEMQAALEGADTLYLVSALEAPNRVELHRTAIDAALGAGVKRIVYTSFLGAAPDATFTFARDHFHTEEHLRASGVDFTAPRNSLYLDYMPFFAGADGVIRGTAGDGRVAPVARDDIADAGVAVLLGDGRAGRTYDLTGPEALTLREVAERLSMVAGREVRFVDETMEEARASRAPSGEPDWVIEGWVTTYAAIASGELELVSDTVSRLTGHHPMDLDEFLRRYPDSYEHLVGG